MFSTSFSTVNPGFLQDDLFFSKKSVYMKNAEERARFEIFCRKSWIFKYSLSKPQKLIQNCAIDLRCGFLRNWSVIISMLCGHKIALSSHRCHFNAIGSWKELFKPSMDTSWGVLSAISELPELLTAGVRAARRCIGFCMEM